MGLVGRQDGNSKGCKIGCKTVDIGLWFALVWKGEQREANKKKKRKSKNSESVETRQVSKYSVKSLYDVFIQNMDVDKNQKRDLQTFSGIGLIRKVDEN